MILEDQKDEDITDDENNGRDENREFDDKSENEREDRCRRNSAKECRGCNSDNKRNVK